MSLEKEHTLRGVMSDNTLNDNKIYQSNASVRITEHLKGLLLFYLMFLSIFEFDVYILNSNRFCRILSQVVCIRLIYNLAYFF